MFFCSLSVVFLRDNGALRNPECINNNTEIIIPFELLLSVNIEIEFVNATIKKYQRN